MLQRQRPVLAAAILMLTACIDISVDPDEIGSIDFAPLPSPSVVAGDSLRDAEGNAIPLSANVYSADGNLLSDWPVTFVTTDTLVHIDENAQLTGDSLEFGSTEFVARLFANASGLQSLVRELRVVPRPDTIYRETDLSSDTIFYSLPAEASDTSMSLAVVLNSYRSSDTIPVPTYVVRYRLVTFDDDTIPSTDTTRVFFMVDDAGRVTTVDTTDGNGARRRLRFRINAGQSAIDSIKVLAEARRGHQFVPGSPIVWTVRVEPKP